MPFISPNILKQGADIAGSINQDGYMVLSDEPIGLGRTAQFGVSASIISFDGYTAVISGLSNFSENSVGRFLTIYGCSNESNNGTFSIVSYISSTSVGIHNPLCILPDSSNNNLSWAERYPYTVEDDFNYSRTDRQLIKGVPYYETVVNYNRARDGYSLPTNLSNISGKTTDAVGFILGRKFIQGVVSVGSNFTTIGSDGYFAHSSILDKTGVPLFDQAPYINDYDGCIVNITDPNTNCELYVGDGYRVFGLSRAGSSTPLNSIEVAFYIVSIGSDLSTSTPYTWLNTNPSIVDFTYGYFTELDLTDQYAFRNSNAYSIIPDLSLMSGASKVGVDPNGTTYIKHDTVQEALEDLDEAIVANAGGAPGNPTITANTHETLRQLIHFLDEGPGHGFVSGAYREVVGQPFPTSVIWYSDNTKQKKIFEELIQRNGVFPSIITYNMYDVDGATIIQTAIDTINYTNGVFEESRIRQIF